MRPDFTTLKLFLSVAEERSIGKAAEREHISAPAISKRIIELEQSLGVTLLERQSIGVSLTAAGAALVVEIRNVLASLDRMKIRLDEYASGQQGMVKILFSPSGQVGLLPDALRSFMAAHPSIEIHLDEKRVPQVVQGVAQGEADIGIFARHPAAGEVTTADALTVYPYQTLRLAVVARNDHPIAQNQQISFEEVVHHDIVSLSEPSAVATLLRKVSTARGLTLNSRLQVTSFDSARRMIQAGLGIGIMSEMSAKPYAQAMNLSCISLIDEWAEYQLNICTRAAELLSRPAQLMLSHLLNAPDSATK